jgi:hypothetical protein
MADPAHISLDAPPVSVVQSCGFLVLGLTDEIMTPTAAQRPTFRLSER